MPRALATVKQIADVRPITGADKIELITFTDCQWQCVSGKNVLKKNDLCIYFEIDSLLPNTNPVFGFLVFEGLKTNADGKTGFRLKTRKFKGVLSQGLALPVSDFIKSGVIENRKYEVGENLTDTLDIVVYEPPISAHLQGEVKSNFPGFIRKTDQERVQNVYKKLVTQLNLFNYNEAKVVVEVKADGTSGTFFRYDDEFGVCSRNLQLKDKCDNTYWKIARQYGIQQRLEQYGKNLAIQGEIIGEGIQKNRDKVKGHKLLIFDIFDIAQQHYLTYNERIKVIEKLNEINVEGAQQLESVPVVTKMNITAETSFEELMNLSVGKGYNSDMREGVVIKTMDRVDGQIFSFKVINNDYLLKGD